MVSGGINGSQLSLQNNGLPCTACLLTLKHVFNTPDPGIGIKPFSLLKAQSAAHRSSGTIQDCKRPQEWDGKKEVKIRAPTLKRGKGRDTTLTQITLLPGSKEQVSKTQSSQGKKEKRGCSHEGGPGRPSEDRHIPGWHLLYRRAGWQGSKKKERKKTSQVVQYQVGTSEEGQRGLGKFPDP